MLYREVKNTAFNGDTLTIQNVELGLFEGRSHLILHDLGTSFIANGVRPVL